MRGLPTKDFAYDPANFSVTDDIKEQYSSNGFVVIRKLFNSGEVAKITEAAEDENGITKYALISDHAKKLTLWNKPGNDITGVISQSEKIAGTMTELMGGEIYPYHGKLIMKEAFSGGAHLWHQDYGYWYPNGCLFPDMGTAYIAVDKCTVENGCLEVLKASHLAGRLDHNYNMSQMEADPDRVDALKKICEHVYVCLEPGDAVFFHCKLVHQAKENRSPNRRYALLYAYNRASNNSFKPHFHASYFPMKILANSEIMKCTNKDMSGKDFLDPSVLESKSLMKDQVYLQRVH
ncbi:L-proline trans-4-hydroxylase-like [Tubulanus polymorphus]|uniref:L-proline trans-4-hydroxylase-like n=1 Tax=Tubulanus polymorphus TaxID=672921 RepID=UPI003DA3FE16